MGFLYHIDFGCLIGFGPLPKYRRNSKPSSSGIIRVKLQGAPMNTSDLEWIKKVEERTNGRVKVTFFQGTMGKIDELYDMVKGGVVRRHSHGVRLGRRTYADY